MLTRLSARAMHTVVQALALEELDKPASPIWLRHSHASHALDNGAPLHWVQHSLGHQNPATTGDYLHPPVGRGSSEFLTLVGLE